jgi:hypothetical protein
MRQWISFLLVETGVIRLDWVLPYEFHLPPPPSPRDDRSDKKSWSPREQSSAVIFVRSDLFCAPIFTLVSFQISSSSLVCLLRQFLTYRGALREENGISWIAMDNV